MELPTAARAGWKAGAQRVVMPSGIFQYMDGAGELYLAYDFKKLYVRGYEKPGQPKITCEAYQMPSSADAYGLFSQDRTGTQLRIGQGAIYASGLLMAWQAKWFVRILADRDTPEAKRCAIALAKAVVKLCGPDGKPPAALTWLPAAKLDHRSVHFFHTHACLNYFHFLATQNLLGLSLKTDAVMGTYSGKAGKSLALVIGYPMAAEPRAAWQEFRRVYLKGLKPSGSHCICKLENGKWVAGVAEGRRMFIVLESPSHEDCTALIRALAGNRATSP
jgi:hypothetical protein